LAFFVALSLPLATACSMSSVWSGRPRRERRCLDVERHVAASGVAKDFFNERLGVDIVVQ
jgi:hypothetical protein